MTNLLEEIEKSYLRQEKSFKIGDTVRVHMKIVEGQKERTQVFAGTVISIKGKGISESFTVYRNAYGSSMERVFKLHSPRIQKIEVLRSSKVRRAKLYYIQGKTGKKAKLKEKIYVKAPRKTITPPVQEEVAISEK